MIETEEIRKRLEGRMKPHDLEYVIGQLQTRDNRLADLESDLPWMLYTFAQDVVGGKHAHYMADARQFIFAYREQRGQEANAEGNRLVTRQEIFDRMYPVKAAGR